MVAGAYRSERETEVGNQLCTEKKNGSCGKQGGKRHVGPCVRQEPGNPETN